MSDLLDFSPPGQATFSLAGAKARFYDAGTTTPRTVYADEAETVPHPSPLLADSSGRFAQAFVSGGAVKVVVTQADDSTGYTLDPCVKVAATGSAAGSVSFTPSVLRPYTNVQDAIDQGTFPPRTITAGAGIGVTNGDGASGNPTIAINRGAPVTKTADFTVGALESWLINNKASTACTVTLPAAASFTGREIMFQNQQDLAVISATSNVVPLRGGSAGTSILPATKGAWAVLSSNGTNWQIVAQSQNLNLFTAVAASGTAVDFEGIPDWASRLTVTFSELSTNGTSNLAILGGNGSYESSGYSSGVATQGGAVTLATTSFIVASSVVATSTFTGSITFTRFSGNAWSLAGTIFDTTNSTSRYSAGVKTFSAAIDRLRITTGGGVDTFDGGTIGLMWE